MSSFINIGQCICITLFLGFNHVAVADWKQDCNQLQAPNLQNPCDPIQSQSASLGAYMPPAPFVAPTAGDFSKVDAGASPFPNGSPFGAAPAASGAGATSSEVLPASGGSSSSGSSATGSSSSGSSATGSSSSSSSSAGGDSFQ